MEDHMRFFQVLNATYPVLRCEQLEQETRGDHGKGSCRPRQTSSRKSGNVPLLSCSLQVTTRRCQQLNS